MPKFLQTKINPEILTLEDKLKKGGEGEIWTVRNKPNIIAKIFLKPDLKLEQKLHYMVNNPPKDGVMEKFKFPSIAWPIDLLYSNGDFVGYLMPRVSESLEIIKIYNPSHRENYPEFHWKALIHVARNLATTVHTLHCGEYVIGDISSKNILVDRKTTLVTIIDTDSFQVVDNHRIYPCKVTTSLFIPPELTSTDKFRMPEHDYFGLGIIIFYLLMEGRHPFSGKLNDHDDSISMIEDHLLKKKIFPYEKNNVASPHPHPSYEILPKNIQGLFHRCFVTGLDIPSDRPSAKEWLEALKTLEESVIKCSYDDSHYYSRHRASCPWCYKDEDLEIIREPLKSPALPKPLPPPHTIPSPPITQIPISIAMGLLLSIIVFGSCLFFFVITYISPGSQTNMEGIVYLPPTSLPTKVPTKKPMESTGTPTPVPSSTPTSTPTPTSTETQVIQQVGPIAGPILYGPVGGRLIHTTPGIPVVIADVDIRDFIVEVRLYNPHDLPPDGWVYSLGFHSTSTGAYALNFSFMPNGGQILTLFLNTQKKNTGTINKMNVLPGEANLIRLEVKGGTARLLINDEPMAILDISEWSTSGEIWIDATDYTSTHNENWSARYEDFTIWDTR